MKGKKYLSLLSVLAMIFVLISVLSFYSCSKEGNLLAGSFRKEADGWIIVHVEGNPHQLGYQHGYLLADEIANKVIPNVKFYIKNVLGSDWDTFREVVKKIHWVKTPEEYQQEIEGIAAGLSAKGIKGIDAIDIAVLNNWLQIAWSYLPWSKAQDIARARLADLPPGACSAFIATGTATKDGSIVMAHNTWIDYVYGVHWNLILDLKPENGNRIMTQTCPGFIHSGPDWCMNSSGLMVAETTIAGFFGFDPEGIPETIRLRRAMQYASTIDEWLEIMIEGANGEYSNDWLIGDAKTNEIACLELGLKSHQVWRKKDGYLMSSNIAQDPEVRKETNFPYDDPQTSMASRWNRWQQLLEENYGKIDEEMAKKLISDHFDVTLNKEQPGANTICGHIELDERGVKPWEFGPYYPCGAVDGKVVSSDLNKKWQMWCAFGHPCGIDFKAADFLRSHQEYSYLEPELRDLVAHPWTLINIK